MVLNISPEELEEILSKVDLSGFTHLFRGNPKRYVVGLTNNTEWCVPSLALQVFFYSTQFEAVWVGWRQSPNWDVFIDVVTNTDDFNEAHYIGTYYSQQCIWDNKKQEEIRI